MLCMTVLILTFVNIFKIENFMDYSTASPCSFYIAASVFALLAIVTATGVLDSLFCKKYAPWFKNGKFVWKQVVYNRKRMRMLSVLLFVVISIILFAVPECDVSEVAFAISVLMLAVIFSIVASVWAVEKR